MIAKQSHQLQVAVETHSEFSERAVSEMRPNTSPGPRHVHKRAQTGKSNWISTLPSDKSTLHLGGMISRSPHTSPSYIPTSPNGARSHGISLERKGDRGMKLRDAQSADNGLQADRWQTSLDTKVTHPVFHT
jgi:hypothetical protein